MRLSKPPATELKPLKVTCTSSDCANGLHCFKPTRKMRMADQTGRCRSCGAELIDWERIQARDLSDVIHTFAALKHELYRHYYWHVDIDRWALNYARRKGKAKLRLAIEPRLRKSVGAPAGPYDGRQTPRERNPIYYAQHATATCCRGCLKRWHGVPSDRALTDDEIQYLGDLVGLYLDERLPSLPELGQKIPPIRPATVTTA